MAGHMTAAWKWQV